MGLKKSRSGTFMDNMKLPVHRWFRYSAGFSAEWVEEEIVRYREETGNEPVVLDPFVGSGTTVLAGCKENIASIGVEAHHFVYRVAKAKSHFGLDINDFEQASKAVLDHAKTINSVENRHHDSPLLLKCYSDENFNKLDSLKTAYETLKTEAPVWEMVWLNITSLIRPCSAVGTAQWQYVLPNKTKTKVLDPYEAFAGKMGLMSEDMATIQKASWSNDIRIYNEDMRVYAPQELANLVITSPPYPNNYDYADATRLEMTFWEEIEGWKDLQSNVRHRLLRSCSQHAAAERLTLDELLSYDELSPIKDEIGKVVKELAEVRLTKGGKKSYHTMIAAYFYDLSRIFINLRQSLVEGSRMCFVIGDSAPYGVHAPAEKWLGELALAAGFRDFNFEKLRDRNVKWKNRTHTVPLHEGRLWIEG